MTESILDVTDLGVAFGGLRAVDGVSFAVRRQRITTVIGPNGAGKSTLFNLICGSLRPHRGRVVFDGVDMTAAAPQRMRKAGLGRSFQITNIFAELSVAENLRLAASVLDPVRRWLLPVGLNRRVQQDVDGLLHRFGLAGKADAVAGTLSHGEQRWLEIALSLASRPKLLMLDEPTQGMSHGDTARTASLLRELAGGVSILLIEHDIRLVMEISDHVVVMHQGRLLNQGRPRDMQADPAVQDAYFGHV